MKAACINKPLAQPSDRRLDTRRLLPVAALLAAVFLWGGSFAAMRLAVQAMHPLTVVWLRMIIALAAVLPFAGRLKIDAYRSGDWKLLAPMVILQPCLYFLLESNALRYTTSSQAGVISALVPLLVAVGAWLMLAEPVARHAFVGLALAVAGVAVLSLTGAGDAAAANPLLGNGLELGAMISAAANMILVKRLSDRYDPWLLTALQVLAGSLFFSPGLVLLMRSPGVDWTFTLVLALLFLGALVTLGAFGLYNWAMSRIPASRAAAYINLVPVTAVAIGWLAMGEALNGWQSAAAMAVIVGVVISQKGG